MSAITTPTPKHTGATLTPETSETSSLRADAREVFQAAAGNVRLRSPKLQSKTKTKSNQG